MERILHIAASPAGAQSRSRRVAEHFIAAYARHRPAPDLREADVWTLDLPPFDAEMIAAKFAVLRANEATPEQARRWQRAVSIARLFNDADLYVLSVPMWNFGIPYRLKHFIDVATLPGENWRWRKDEGYSGLLQGRRAVVVYSSAGDYPVEARHPKDHQKGAIRAWLAFVGITEVHEINVAPTLAAPQEVDRTVRDACEEAERVAARLARLTPTP